MGVWVVLLSVHTRTFELLSEMFNRKLVYIFLNQRSGVGGSVVGLHGRQYGRLDA